MHSYSNQEALRCCAYMMHNPCMHYTCLQHCACMQCSCMHSVYDDGMTRRIELSAKTEKGNSTELNTTV